MFSKKHNKEIKQLFFTSFGKSMSLHKSKNGNSVKWLNYPTNVKDVYFRIQCNKSSASIFIDIQHRDEEIRKLFYEQFLELKILFKNKIGDNWTWQNSFVNEVDKKCCRISRTIDNVNINNKETWSISFNFYKENLIKLDAFWVEFSDLFKELND